MSRLFFDNLLRSWDSILEDIVWGSAAKHGFGMCWVFLPFDLDSCYLQTPNRLEELLYFYSRSFFQNTGLHYKYSTVESLSLN